MTLILNIQSAIDMIIAEATLARKLAKTDSEQHGWAMVLFEMDTNIRRRVEKGKDITQFHGR